MNGRLKDKIALVTGSSTGIGESIARRFASEGASVMVHGLSEPEAQSVVEAIHEQGGKAVYAIEDLADPDACRRLIAAVLDQFGRLDILVNNAAMMTRSDLDSTTADVFDRTLAVNVRAPLLLIQAAQASLKQSRGAILNIGSVNGYCGEKNQLAYAISKGGLLTLSRNLADALGPDGVRVNHFNLGWVLTKNEYALKRREGLPDDWPQKLPAANAPSGRLITPEEIAHFALAFVESEGGPISGAVVELEQYPMIGRNPPKEVR
jgi:NAD(P)-dependent dehydrogenase (short-subunit alcohol dehydrogenase family)